jgi:hypothetical protein
MPLPAIAIPVIPAMSVILVILAIPVMLAILVILANAGIHAPSLP